jgi:hypothetical protein
MRGKGRTQGTLTNTNTNNPYGSFFEIFVFNFFLNKKTECKQVQIAVDKKGAKPLMINYRQMGQPRCVQL